MRSPHVCVWMCLVAVVPVVASGQGRQGASAADRAREAEKVASRVEAGPYTARFETGPGDVLNGPVVTDAPFSADAITTVTQILGDGTRIETTTSARFFRDRMGRVRREQTIVGLGALNAASSVQTITVDPDPADGMAYTLDPATRTAYRVPRLVFFSGSVFRLNTGTIMLNGRGVVAAPAGRGAQAGTQESLGTRQFDGVKAVGRKTTSVIPTGQIGNDRPIEITDERWESPELRMLVYSRNSDPRTGVVEYRLTNINRSEPPPDLFVVPADYTINEAAGERGRGGRGGRETAPGVR